MIVRKIVIDTDIIADHLTTGETVSTLRRLLQRYFCYTTVFTAMELFAMARTQKEIRAVEDAMHAMKILGLNGKSAKKIAHVLNGSRTTMAGFIAGICIESALPVVTFDTPKFRGIKKLEIISVATLLKT